MPKVVDGLIATHDVVANGQVQAATLKLTTGATNGYFLQSDADGVASWAAAPTDEDVCQYSTVAVSDSYTIDGTHDMIIINNLSDGNRVGALPRINNEGIYGRVFQFVNIDPDFEYALNCDENDRIDDASTGGIIMPKNGSKITLVAGGAADHRWYTL